MNKKEMDKFNEILNKDIKDSDKLASIQNFLVEIEFNQENKNNYPIKLLSKMGKKLEKTAVTPKLMGLHTQPLKIFAIEKQYQIACDSYRIFALNQVKKITGVKYVEPQLLNDFNYQDFIKDFDESNSLKTISKLIYDLDIKELISAKQKGYTLVYLKKTDNYNKTIIDICFNINYFIEFLKFIKYELENENDLKILYISTTNPFHGYNAGNNNFAMLLPIRLNQNKGNKIYCPFETII